MQNEEKREEGTIRSACAAKWAGLTRFVFADRSESCEQNARNPLLVGGTRGGWRDGKSEVRVSGSWNRQGAKARLEARH